MLQNFLLPEVKITRGNCFFTVPFFSIYFHSFQSTWSPSPSLGHFIIFLKNFFIKSRIKMPVLACHLPPNLCYLINIPFALFVYVCLSLSWVQLFVTPWTISPGSIGFFGQESWVVAILSFLFVCNLSGFTKASPKFTDNRLGMLYYYTNFLISLYNCFQTQEVNVCKACWCRNIFRASCPYLRSYTIIMDPWRVSIVAQRIRIWHYLSITCHHYYIYHN